MTGVGERIAARIPAGYVLKSLGEVCDRYNTYVATLFDCSLPALHFVLQIYAAA